MIIIYHPPGSRYISSWKERLDEVFIKYEMVEDTALLPRLVDGDKQVEGIAAIEAYLEGLGQFVKGWYEDRCDRYDFDPEA